MGEQKMQKSNCRLHKAKD